MLDRIIDWFQGAPRRSKLEKLVKQVCEPEAGAEPSAASERQNLNQRVRAFYELKRMAKPEFQDRFTMTMESTLPDGLRYILKIDGTEFQYENTVRTPLQTCIDFNRIASCAGFEHAHGMKLQGDLLARSIERELRSTGHGSDDLLFEQSINDLKRCIDEQGAASRPYEDPMEALSRQLTVASMNSGSLPISLDLDMHGKGDMIQCAVLLTIHGQTGDGGANKASKHVFRLYDGKLKAKGSENVPMLVLHSFRLRLQNEVEAQWARWNDPNDLVETNAATVTDCDATRAFLCENLDDPGFSSQTLSTVEPDRDGSTWFVTFRHPGGDKKLALSSRSSSNGEFRGEPLKIALERRFSSLRDLLSKDFQTKNDPRVRVSMSRLFSDVKAMKDALSVEHRARFVEAFAPKPLFQKGQGFFATKTTLGEVLESEFNAFRADGLGNRRHG